MQLNRDTMSGKMPREQLGSRSNIIPSLAELASRAVEERLNNMCDEIPDEAEDRIADRRQRLHAELAVLANEKQEYINKRMVELSLERETALEHMSVATGKSNQYCTKCKKIYIEDESKCSVPGCVHACSAESHEDEEEGSDYRPYECWFENNVMGEIANMTKGEKDKNIFSLDSFSYDSNIFFDFNEPSKTGCTKCWICSLPFCNRDFEKHYDKCRAKASIRCGFRPPTPHNGRGYVCVPGHCGKEVTINDEAICCPDACDTVCCNKCFSTCENEYEGSDDEYDYWGRRNNNICGEGLCKFCVANGHCYGKCSFC